MTARLRGVLAPVLTPFTRRLEPDVGRFIAHCRWLVDNHAGLAIFGTNSEAASLSVEERLALTDALLEAGIPAAKMMPGTGRLLDQRRRDLLTRHAVENGAAGVLMVPPFYYKGVSDDGVFAYYSEVIERVGDDRLAVYLYHIPQLTHVPITFGVIERLLKRYPKSVAGAKDSSGDWNNSKAMIDIVRRRRVRRLPGERVAAVEGARDRRRRVHQRDRQHESGRHPRALRELEHRAGRSAAGAGGRAAQDLSGADDDRGDEARGRGIRARAGLARRASPADHHGRCGSFDATRRTARASGSTCRAIHATDPAPGRNEAMWLTKSPLRSRWRDGMTPHPFSSMTRNAITKASMTSRNATLGVSRIVASEFRMDASD